MKLDLQVSPRMSRAEENEVVRLTNKVKNKLGVSTGQKLDITTYNKNKLTLRVSDPHIEDLIDDNKASWVSQETFDLIIGNPLPKGEVTLGCDPEFVVLNQQKRIIPASYWLPTKGEIGSDGDLVEFRPSPGTHETQVVENLRRLIKQVAPRARSKLGKRTFSVEAHSCWQNQAMGFHIHLGAPRELLTFAAPRAKEFIKSFISAMDYFVGIPAMLPEDSNLRRLGDGIYGKPGDFRLTHKTIEYRTPGGFHLRHPVYAAGIMGLALCFGKTALELAHKESNGWRKMDEVAEFSWFQKNFGLPQRSKIRWALEERSKKEAVSQLPMVIDRITDLKKFTDHENSIRKFFRSMLYQGYSPNILENW